MPECFFRGETATVTYEAAMEIEIKVEIVVDASPLPVAALPRKKYSLTRGNVWKAPLQEKAHRLCGNMVKYGKREQNIHVDFEEQL